MNEQESISVAPNEDNGNVPAEEIAPVSSSQQTKEPETVSEKPEPVAPTAPELYELPDGRKVDGATLSKEFRENFLPEFTRKSQELANLKGGKTEKSDINKPTETDPLLNPEYVPNNYAELAKIIKESTLKELEQKEQVKLQQHLAIENAVNEQLNAIKAQDKNVNENALFLHATKYGFRDLKLAHQNMIDMANLAKTVKQATVKDIQKRNDPVSISPGASGGTKPDPSNFATARDYLRSLQQ